MLEAIAFSDASASPESRLRALELLERFDNAVPSETLRAVFRDFILVAGRYVGPERRGEMLAELEHVVSAVVLAGDDDVTPGGQVDLGSDTGDADEDSARAEVEGDAGAALVLGVESGDERATVETKPADQRVESRSADHDLEEQAFVTGRNQVAGRTVEAAGSPEDAFEAGDAGQVVRADPDDDVLPDE